MFQRQNGSRATDRHPLAGRATIVPLDGRDVKQPLLKMILRQAGLTEEEFIDLL